ncbi:MAG TPA: hypothetical protein VKQ29_14695 [Aliidongia sp.]|nr:hypothetical protein [Aliidongia sp.]
MDTKSTDEQYSDEEATRRRDEIIKRMINTPPKPHAPKSKTRPASKGRVHKGKTHE